MANPQADRFVKISNELWDEVIRRDFSKRQKDIIMFVWRLSYGCQSKLAHIPKMKDFELCGVPATQVKRELEYLEECHVLFWERDEMIFQINKDYEKWYVSLVKSWRRDRFKELLSLNIEHSKTSQNMKFSSEDDDEKTSQNMKSDFMNHEDSEEQNFTFHEDGTSQNMKKNFIKREVEEGSNPWGSKAEEGSKDSKDIIKDIKDLKAAATITPENDPSISNQDQQFIEVLDTFCELHNKMDFHVNGIDRQLIREVVEKGIPVPLIQKVMRQVYESRTIAGKKIHSFSYYEDPIIEAWTNEQAPAAPTPQQPRQIAVESRRSSGPTTPSAEESRKYLDEIDELRRQKRERLQREGSGGMKHGT